MKWGVCVERSSKQSHDEMTNAFMAGTLCTILVQTKAVLAAGEWAGVCSELDYWCLHWLRGVNKNKKKRGEREGGRKRREKREEDIKIIEEEDTDR